jgi:hypothetical protein
MWCSGMVILVMGRLNLTSSRRTLVLASLISGGGTVRRRSVFIFGRRVGRGHPYVMEAVQYAPIVQGNMWWDIMAHYQGNVNFEQGAPNHVKLVISGRRVLVYVNGAVAGAAALGRPTLDIGELEGNTTHGSIGFSGQAIISNSVLKPGKVEGLSPVAATDPVANDPRYLRPWQMTTPDSLAPGSDQSDAEMAGEPYSPGHLAQDCGSRGCSGAI